jgi:hypothetical protein
MKKYYDPNTFTWGYELELGDVRRDREIPSELGTWEHAETDITNTHPPYWGKASDPLGIDPPVGGEINIRPTRTIGELSEKIQNTIEWFRNQGDRPSASCTNVGHVHVHVPGLIEDIAALTQLTQYISENQQTAINACWGYKELPKMKETRTARTYMKWDGGRTMPIWMSENIIDKANNFDDFIRIQCCGKDGKSRGRPFRYALNTYCLKHTKTIEFRCFRASLEKDEIFSSILFVREFMNAALNTWEPISSILNKIKFCFPPMTYDHELYLSWEKTKWDKSRGKKDRKYYEVK